jgi:hypothetical protein
MHEEFMAYANSFGRGYVKPWKAVGMTTDFPRMVSWCRTKDETLKWVRNCLEMEGFKTADCEKINDWLWDNLNG